MFSAFEVEDFWNESDSRQDRIFFVKKAYVLLIAIRPLDGDVKPGGYFGAFRKE